MSRTLLLFAITVLAARAESSDILQDVNTRPPMAISDFEQLATANNPTLKQANLLVQRSAALAHQASLYPNPTIGYRGEQLRGGQFGGGENGAFIQQDIILGGKLKLRAEVNEQQRREDEIGVNEQRYRILGDVGRSFYSALAAQEVVNLRRQLLDVTRDLLVTTRQLQNVGQADAPDVLQSEVESEQAETEYIAAQRAYLQEFRSLAILVGNSDLRVSPLAGDLHQPPQLDEATLLDHITKDSPSLKKAQQDVLRAQAALKSARREPFPDLQIQGGVQQNSERLAENSPRAVGLQAFASVGVNLPLFNRNQGNIAAEQVDLERAEAEVSRVRLSLRRDSESAMQTYLSDRAQAQKYKDVILPRAERAYKLYLEKYRTMAAAYPQVLLSQRSFFELQITYVTLLRNMWLTAIELQNFNLSSGLTAPTIGRAQ